MKQSETERGQSACSEPINKGVNYCSKDVTQTQQQRPESPTVTLTWHASKRPVAYFLYRKQGGGGGGERKKKLFNNNDVHLACTHRHPEC